MRTWRTNKFMGRLSALLIALGHPFRFDGAFIEFDATPEYILFIERQDPKLKKIWG